MTDEIPETWQEFKKIYGERAKNILEQWLKITRNSVNIHSEIARTEKKKLIRLEKLEQEAKR